MSAAQPANGADIGKLIGPVATALLGAPNRVKSTRDELRFGTNGSMSVDLGKGVWHCHEDDTKGGVLDLVARQRKTDRAGALAWLEEQNFLPPASKPGQPRIVATYDYRDEAGDLLFQIVRREPKDFRQRRPDGNGGWSWKLGDLRRVLYRLPEVLAAVAAGRVIHIVEGEKSVDRLVALGLDTTCSPGGAGKWRADYSPALRGADVVILADNDEPGEKHGRAVAASLAGVARSAKLLALPGLPPKGDVVDWIEAGGTAEELARLAEAAPPAESPSPAAPADAGNLTADRKRPLHRELPPAQPYPVAALGSLRPAAEAIQQATQAPIAICAQSVLAAAALAICAHRDVEGPPGLGRRPLTGLFISVAGSGERKSACDRLALRPVHEIEKGWRGDYEGALETFKREKAVWTAACKAAERRCKSDRAALRQAFDEIGPEPKEPLSPMLLVEDATPQAITLHLAAARPWCGQFSAEGGVIVGGHGMSDESKTRTCAFYNGVWDGSPIRRNRVGTGTTFLPGRRVCAHWMMQQDIASAMLTDAVMGDIGTLARMLVVAPDSTAGTRFFQQPDRDVWRALDAYTARIRAWFEHPPRMEQDCPGALDPVPMSLDEGATALWVRFHDAAEADLATGGTLAPIRAWGAKLPEHALRLAAILAAFDDPETLTIGNDAMARGITLAKHYAGEMLRLHGGASVPADLAGAQRLLAWWQARTDSRCHLAAVYQTGPEALRDAATARHSVAVLVEHGWVTPLPPDTVLDGKPRREAWELVP